MTSDTSSDTQPQPPAGSSRFRDAVRLVVWCVVCLAAPPLILRDGPPEADTPAVGKPDETKRGPGADEIDGQAAIKELRAAQPEYIGIGNSMMFTRLGNTPSAMSALTGRKFFFLYKAGSEASIWFLMLKNIVAASGVRPKAVFFFVRDNELTTPYIRRVRGYSPYLRSLRGDQEPELDAFMFRTQSGAAMVGRVDHWLESSYSFSESQERMTRGMTDLAMDIGGMGSGKKALRFALSSRFGLEHLRGDTGADRHGEDALSLMTSGYEETVDQSLLPAMMRLAEKSGIKLLFFRVKKRPDAETHLPPEPGAMRDYADFLNRWLSERGGIFFDETYDTSIHLTDYLESNHIRPERMEWYRDYFWKRVKGLFP